MDDSDVRHILGLRTWAVVGCSPSPARDSHKIARMLMGRGYRVIPVNPAGCPELLGEPCYAELPADQGIEVVDLFRRSSAVSAHVDEAIAIGAKAVWMQLGVIDETAAARAREAGLRVVMNRCPAIEIPRLEALERR
jgi:predicted CoA-binding protein